MAKKRKKRKIPQRMCVGCGTGRDKRELVRIVRTPEGEVQVDPTGKKSGRGAYLCPNPDCLQEALKRKKLDRALKTSLSEETVAQIRVEFEA